MPYGIFKNNLSFVFYRTYVRTLTKLSVFGPSEILLANSGGGGGGPAGDMADGGGASQAGGVSNDTKLYQEIADEFPSTYIVTIHRKYFKDIKVSAFTKLKCYLL